MVVGKKIHLAEDVSEKPVKQHISIYLSRLALPLLKGVCQSPPESAGGDKPPVSAGGNLTAPAGADWWVARFKTTKL